MKFQRTYEITKTDDGYQIDYYLNEAMVYSTIFLRKAYAIHSGLNWMDSNLHHPAQYRS